MKLLRALLITTALVAPGSADAAPVIVAAAAGALSAGIPMAAGVVTYSALTIAGSAFLSGAMAGLQMLMARSQQPKPQTPNSAIRQATPVLPRVYGRCRVGGFARVWHAGESSGAEKRNLHALFVLAAHEIDAIEAVYDGDRLMWSAAGGVAAGYADRLDLVYARTGAAGQTVPSGFLAELPDTFDSAATATLNAHLTGLPYVTMRFRNRAKRWVQGLPSNLWFLVRGAKVPDPRTNQTIWTANWALCVADYLTHQGGVGEYIDAAALIAAANLCDEDVTLDAGGTQKRYELHGGISTAQAARDALPELLAHAAASYSWDGEALRLHPGAYSAPTHSFGADDFVGPLQLAGETLIEDRWDAVEGVYAKPEAQYAPAPWARVTLDDYAGPADPRVLTVDLPNETSADRAQRLGLLNLRQSRRQKRATVSVPLTRANAAIIPGERATLTLDPIGLAGVFEIRARRSVYDPANPRVELEVLEDGAAFWSWSADTATAPPPSLGSNLPDPSTVEPPTSVVVTAFARVETDGSTTRWLLVTWSASPDRYLDGYEVRWTQDGAQRRAPTSATRYEIAGALSTAAVSVRVVAINTLGAESVEVAPAGDVTPGGDVTPPGVPPSGAITPIAGGFRFRIGNPADADLAGLRLYEGAAGAAFGACVAILDAPATPGGQPTEFTRVGLAPETTRRYYVTAFDRSQVTPGGNESLPYGPLQDTTPTELSPAEIDAAIAGAVADAAAAQASSAAAIAAYAAVAAAAGDVADRVDVIESTYLPAAAATAQSKVDAAAATLTNVFSAADTALAQQAEALTAGISPSVYTDPTFRQWGQPGGVSAERLHGGGALAVVQTAYGRTLNFVLTAAQMDGITIQSNYAHWRGIKNADAFAFEIEFDVAPGGNPASNYLYVAWYATSGVAYAAWADMASARIDAGAGGPARARAILRRPAGFAGTFAYVRAHVILNWGAAGGVGTPTAQTCALYRVSLQPSTPEMLGLGEVLAFHRQSVDVLATTYGLAVAQAVQSQGASIGAISSEIDAINMTKVDAAGAVAAVDTDVSVGSGGAYASATIAAAALLEARGRMSSVITLSANGGPGSTPAFVNLLSGALVGSAVVIGGDVVQIRGNAITLDGDTVVTEDLTVHGTLNVQGASITAPAVAPTGLFESLPLSRLTSMTSSTASDWKTPLSYTIQYAGLCSVRAIFGASSNAPECQITLNGVPVANAFPGAGAAAILDWEREPVSPGTVVAMRFRSLASSDATIPNFYLRLLNTRTTG